MTGAAPEVSVVVPTRDRPGPLLRCLAALEAQTTPSFEVVVVDDGSVDHASVARVVDGAPHARLVRGEGRGPAAARNAGVAAARAPLVCLTDDDCAPVPGWAAALAARSAVAVAVAGPTRNADRRNRFAAASQAVASHLAEGSVDPVSGRMRFAPTSNLACRTAVLRELPFDEAYPLAAGEDRDWCARLLAAGHDLRWEPAAVVDHHQSLDARAFWRQQVRYGRGAARFRRGRGAADRPGAPAFYGGLVRRAAREGGLAAVALVGVAQVATAVGMAREARSPG